MSAYKSNSGQNIIYVDYTNSAISTSLYQSSADPTNPVNILPSIPVMFVYLPVISITPLSPSQSIDKVQPSLKPSIDEELETWAAYSDEALAALYDEAAEEDQILAQLGLSHYAELLRQEDNE